MINFRFKTKAKNMKLEEQDKSTENLKKNYEIQGFFEENINLIEVNNLL